MNTSVLKIIGYYLKAIIFIAGGYLRHSLPIGYTVMFICNFLCGLTCTLIVSLRPSGVKTPAIDGSETINTGYKTLKPIMLALRILLNKSPEMFLRCRPSVIGSIRS